MPTIPYLPTPVDVAIPKVPMLDHEERPRVNIHGVLDGMERLGEAARMPGVDEGPFVSAAGAMGHALGGALKEAGSVLGALAIKRQEAIDKEHLHGLAADIQAEDNRRRTAAVSQPDPQS